MTVPSTQGSLLNILSIYRYGILVHSSHGSLVHGAQKAQIYFLIMELDNVYNILN